MCIESRLLRFFFSRGGGGGAVGPVSGLYAGTEIKVVQGSS